MKTITCPNCQKENDVTQNYCFFCGASLSEKITTGQLSPEKVNRGPAEVRWGRLPFQHDNTFDLYIPQHDEPLAISLHDGEQALLGRGAPTTNKGSSVEDTLAVASPEMRARLLEAVRQGVSNVEGLAEPPKDEPRFIDLAPYGAREAGVSRRHALLARSQTLLTLTPLKTTNGTRLNGTPLTPGYRRVIRDGDKFQLGSMILSVSFRAPG